MPLDKLVWFYYLGTLVGFLAASFLSWRLLCSELAGLRRVLLLELSALHDDSDETRDAEHALEKIECSALGCGSESCCAVDKLREEGWNLDFKNFKKGGFRLTGKPGK